jgi:pimeloyl-ACP methyl ester carboxylesterase
VISMTSAGAAVNSRNGSIRRWLRRGVLLWAILSTLWLANSVRTQGVPDGLLQNSQGVSVLNRPKILEFLPAIPHGTPALIFICGSGISAHGYAPLLRPIAEAGYPVFIVKLPYRFAPLPSHKDEVMVRARSLMAAHPEIAHWVISGHSLGGALAARVVQADRGLMAALVLIGTAHPKSDDLSTLNLPVTKVYATNDGIAPVDRVLAGKGLLPAHSEWVVIEGGNHSQFGHYGHQLFDGKATISREAQQAVTRAVLLKALAGAAD